MKLSELHQNKRAVAPVAGERYTIKSFVLHMAEDGMNQGQLRPVVKMETDKGWIYAPNSFARSIKESLDDGEDVNGMIIGHTVECVQFHSKKWNKDILTFEFIDE